MEDKAVTVHNDNRKALDSAKIYGGIPPNFDKKVVCDVELIEFPTEVLWTVGDHSTAHRYTGAIPASCTGPS